MVESWFFFELSVSIAQLPEIIPSPRHQLPITAGNQEEAVPSFSRGQRGGGKDAAALPCCDIQDTESFQSINSSEQTLLSISAKFVVLILSAVPESPISSNHFCLVEGGGDAADWDLEEVLHEDWPTRSVLRIRATKLTAAVISETKDDVPHVPEYQATRQQRCGLYTLLLNEYTTSRLREN